jgi:NAD(P)-dependent dehydrogenase (short-subunit alcohol dehydrogenase family)
VELRGRNALLTGAAGGLGRFIARSLAAEGTNLALCDLPSASVDDVLTEVRQRGIRAEPVPADLTDTAGLEMLVRHAEEAIGPLDILVNNAGLEFGGAFGHQTREELEAIVSVNLLAVMELTRVVLPGMLERRRGHVVNLASMAGKGAFPYLASYSATKHAVVGFTHAMRGEYADEPVGFSAICPIFISGVGMYARHEGATPNPPALLTPKPPQAVGEAVVKAIREDRAEMLVARAGLRPVIAIHALAPKLAQWLNNRGGFREFAESYSRVRGRL